MATLFEPFDPDQAAPPVPAWIAALAPSQGFVERALVSEGQTEALDPKPEEQGAQSDATFEAGRQAGLAEARTEFEIESSARSKLSSRIDALDQAASKALQTRLADLIGAICEAVLGEQAIDPASLQARCEKAARALGMPLDRITLHLHPQDAAMLDAGFAAVWKVEDDCNCERGTIRLEAGEKIVRDGPQDWQRAIAEAIRT